MPEKDANISIWYKAQQLAESLSYRSLESSVKSYLALISCQKTGIPGWLPGCVFIINTTAATADQHSTSQGKGFDKVGPCGPQLGLTIITPEPSIASWRVNEHQFILWISTSYMLCLYKYFIEIWAVGVLFNTRFRTRSDDLAVWEFLYYCHNYLN